MKNLTITAPDEIFNQSVDALAYLGGYVDVDENNDTLKLEFAKEQLITVLGDKVREYARQQIRKQAQVTIETTINTTFEQIAATWPSIVVNVETIP